MTIVYYSGDISSITTTYITTVPLYYYLNVICSSYYTKKVFTTRVYRVSIQLGMLAATFLVRFSDRFINIARRYFEQNLLLKYDQCG